MHLGPEFMRATAGAIAGILYGSALAYLSMGAADGGQGTSVPLLMSLAPISAFNLTAHYFAIPALWALLGMLIAFSDRPKARRLVQAALLLHYLSGIVLATLHVDSQHLVQLYMGKEPFLAGWLVLYLVGQVLTWEYMRPQQVLR